MMTANVSQTVLMIINTKTYPGQEFSIRLAAVSYLWDVPAVVPGIITADMHSNATLEQSQMSQATNVQTCTNVNYSLSTVSVDRVVNFSLFASTLGTAVIVTVHLLECPLGFPLSHTMGKCQCDSTAYHYNLECNVNTHSYFRSANSRTWIGFINKSSNTSRTPGVMYHPNCPIGYCSRHDVNITSNTSDDQCEPHRTGLLCGECEEGYSLTLGDGKCGQCSNTYLLLILPLALSGLFFVAILFALNLTVSFTTLQYPDGTVRHVWLYDANVEFFKGKHLYLGIASILVLVFLIVPYTLCLTFFQQLQACSGHRLFQWVNKLKPVFDSYAGPYKDKCRFWTGMLLVARTLLLILFTANTEASIDFSSLVVLVVSVSLLLANTNGAYKKLPCNFLESFFYLQLVVFAGSLLYVNNNHGNITAVAGTSFGLSLVVFLAVLGYHVLRQMNSFKTHYRLKGYNNIGQNEVSFDHERMNE